MAPAFENDRSHQDPAMARDALVDINTESPQPAEPESEGKPRRKRLSDVQESTDGPPSESAPQPESKRKRLSDVQESTDSLPCESAPQPESKPQRQRLSVVERADVEDLSEEPKPSSGRPKLSLAQPQTAVLEAPDDAERPHAQDNAPAPADAGKTPAKPLDPARVEQWIADLRARQSLLLAAGSGVLAAVVGALIWAVISVLTQYFSWIAIGAALLVGGVVRVFGRGLDRQFGYLGATLSLCSCILGNYLANCLFIAREVNLSFTSVLTQIDPAAIPRLLTATFRPADIVFYGLAVYLGYFFSFHRITEAQIRRALSGK